MRFKLLAPALAILLISACATVSTAPSSMPANAAAEQLIIEGKFREAALAYESEATLSKGAPHDAAIVRAANAWKLAGDENKAKNLIAPILRKKLSGDVAFLHDLLNAEFLLADKRGAEAIMFLNQRRDSIPSNERNRWHTDRYRAFDAAGLKFDVAGEQIWLMDGMKPKERAAAGRNIERLLSLVPAAELAQKSASLSASEPFYAYAARELKKRGMPLPMPVASSLSNDRSNAFPPAESDGYRPPNQLAVLLPLSGNSAGAGIAVRDGFLSQYYAENRRRPRINFYDTAGSADGARSAASKAIAEGAQMIVGPLTRDEVNAVSNQTDVNVPVLFLNRGQNPPAPGNLSFALSPDEEGWISADRFANRNQMSVIIFTQRDDTAQRTVAAFKDQYKIRGGQVIAEQFIEGEAVDLPAKITGLLAANNANASAVYIALKAPQARALMTQLKTSNLGGTPKLAASLILNGASASLDGVLDGIEMPELPWLLNQYGGLANADSVAKTMPSIRGPAQRLFAFGADAWQLSAYLDRLQKDAGFMLAGATGNLRVDSMGNVQRDPSWAVFSGGRPRVAAR
ncbi:MAG: penicillin-binding protein activator [Arenimonas sp.]